MAGENNSLRSTGADQRAKATGKKAGFTIDPGPYEATVQGHVQGSRMGQLIVSIADWGGEIPNPDAGSAANTITVSYASPFYGSTFGSDSGLTPNNPQQSGQSYGMWMVPPDIGCKVLVVFAAGDMSRGYWFACIYDSPSHHMVPGIGRNVGGASNTKAPPASDGVNSYLHSDSNVPVVEYNITSSTSFSTDGLVNTPRYPHEVQAMQYVQQGLDRDKIRGAISSSSLRESPSNVYGISTPGRKATAKDQISSNPQAVFFRTGGHQFVMDDGADGSGQDPAGTDQLIRLRTAGGHQILMNDTVEYTSPSGKVEKSGILYIASKTGSQWLEFSSDGSINVYGAAGFNLRSSGAINMHSDAAITMNAPSITMNALASAQSYGLSGITMSSTGGISMTSLLATTIKADLAVSISAVGAVNVSAGAALKMGAIGGASLSAGGALYLGASGVTSVNGTSLLLNSPKPVLPTIPAIPIPAVPLIPNFLPDTLFDGASWVNGGTKLPTICSVAPAHEPWVGPDGISRPAPVSSLINLGIGLAGGLASAVVGSSGAADAVGSVIGK